MSTVLLTRSECERSRFPRVCARCGRPADDAVRLTVLTPAADTFMGVIRILYPPLLPIAAQWLLRRRSMCVPMCPADRADWEWRVRVTSRSYLFVIGTFLAAPVMALVGADPRPWQRAFVMAAALYLAVWTAWVIPVAVRWTRTVRTTKVTAEGLRLSGVHPAFVAAVRDARATDPNRPGWFGDVRDDYDDEPG